ncbi:MAG TPA: SET domain-containing protein-lysine N-methyltransferase [Steroidobacter sp.]|jgi:SET domain-containing protein|nr:SET domain-containing protein-lysine N-methyltransferase [Steroidobacteraceae bacterium]HLS82290.1 SET domain-containing protein-lysine N-methyltransferase [Steroidobacter sp.]
MAVKKSRHKSRGKTRSSSRAAAREPVRSKVERSRATQRTRRSPSIAASPLVETRDSPIHGRGVYALAPIRKGARIMEYIGERISHAEADRRYANKGEDDGHTFLFIASNRTVIDAGRGGNDARFVNHSCQPNCETVIEDGRVFIDAIRNIKPGEELGYDYQLTWESTDDPRELALYACRCGAKRCRGTMLDREPLDKKKENRKKANRKQAATKKR